MKDREEWEMEGKNILKFRLIPLWLSPPLVGSQVPWSVFPSVSPTAHHHAQPLLFSSSRVPCLSLAPFQPSPQSFLKCTLDYVGPSPTPLNGAQDLPSPGPADLSSIFSHLHFSQINDSQAPTPALLFLSSAFVHTFLST